MFRRVLIGVAAAALLSGVPTALSAQPPSPPEVARRVNKGVRRAVTNTDHAVKRAVHRTRHHAKRVSHHATLAAHRSVRAVCNDGRIHTGRTRVTACAGHGGVRG
jgi:hypothetical protein